MNVPLLLRYLVVALEFLASICVCIDVCVCGCVCVFVCVCVCVYERARRQCVRGHVNVHSTTCIRRTCVGHSCRHSLGPPCSVFIFFGSKDRFFELEEAVARLDEFV